MKLKLLLLFVVLFSLETNAQTLNPTVSITDAGTADTFKGGYTFAYPSSGAPWSGPLISFGGFSNQYDCQLNSNYGGNNISFRTRNGDIGTWNAWNELATRGVNTFNGNQIINGEIFVSRSSAEGGAISLVNESKATQYAAREWVIYNMTGGYSNSLQFWSYGNNGYHSGSKFTILDGGNVGVGTTSPTNALTVQKVSGGVGFSGTDGTGGVRVNWSSGYGVALDAWDENEPRWGITRFSGNTPTVIFEGKYNSKDAYFNSGGNVGIGTTNPDQKLTVKGKIHAEEIIVDLAVPADYVFQKYYTGKSTLKSDYVMPTLAEIESFTKKNHHLPNVPSAQEVQQNGMSLGTMSNVLLQKVEELTLYVLEQNKELERLKKENENYKSLAERLSSLEKALIK